MSGPPARRHGQDPGAFWDDKFAGDDYFYGRAPNAFLVRAAHHFAPTSHVLALGEGEGRNAVWLARHGHHVHCLDASARALAKSRALAAENGVVVSTQQGDVRSHRWHEASFDAVTLFFLHLQPEDRPGVHEGLWRSLKPGGILLGQMFHTDQLHYGSGGPPSRPMLVTADQMRADFPVAEWPVLEETVETLDEGRHKGPAALVNFVARKPA